MIPAQLVKEIAGERQEQDKTWGGPEHDDKHCRSDWINFIIRHLGLAVDDGTADVSQRFRKQMIRVAALAIAAIESSDRKHPLEKVAVIKTHGPGY